jgi:hypothetical protein
MSLTAITTNEYGTPVVAGVCDHCGHYYTVCPVPEPDRWDQWGSCLGDECPSYDLSRDIDIFFEALNENGLIGRS